MSYKQLFATGLLFLILAFNNCVERIDLELDQPAGQLVVDALVTTDTSNIQRVLLSRAVPFSSVKDNQEIQSVSGAQVSVSDDQGNVFSFSEYNDGTYLAEFTAETGNDYTLHIETPDGSCYASTPQLLEPSVAIDEIIVRYFSSAQKSPSGFYVYVKPEIRGEGAVFYRWQSHWIKQIGSCFTDPNVLNELRIGSESQEFNEHLVAVVPFGNTSNVLVEFTQYSVNEEVFHIYELIEKQAALEGSIFDPAQGPARSNIFNTTDSGEEVLGIFQVSDVQYGHQMIFRGRYGVRPERPVPNPDFVHPCPGPVPPPDMCPPCPAGTVCQACFYYEGMTTVTPNNWSND